MKERDLRQRTRKFALRVIQLVEAGLVKLERLQPLMVEADELIAITVASIKTARGDSK